MQIEFIIKQIKLPKIRKNTIHNLRNKILCDDCSSFSSGPANAQLMLNNIRLELRGYVAITELTKKRRNSLNVAASVCGSTNSA
jgi:hypothetical protein